MEDRPKTTKIDYRFLKIAISLGYRNLGSTWPNPSVGCVIVKKGEIISVGQTGYGGRPHAEHNAISNCFEDPKDSKMYITLEPCNHYGKTPPCTKNIIKNQIREVYYPIEDIDLKVKGKSLSLIHI